MRIENYFQIKDFDLGIVLKKEAWGNLKISYRVGDITFDNMHKERLRIKMLLYNYMISKSC